MEENKIKNKLSFGLLFRKVELNIVPAESTISNKDPLLLSSNSQLLTEKFE